MLDMLSINSVSEIRHNVRVAELSYRLLGNLGADEKTKDLVYTSAILHDIGKVRIAKSINDKPEKLTPREFEMMKKHVYFGFKLIRSAKFGKDVADIVRYHHENYDGTGYCMGLQGDKIPYGARIVKICDVYDAIKSDRPYHKGKSVTTTLSLMQSQSNEFDPKLFEVFYKMIVGDLLVSSECVKSS